MSNGISILAVGPLGFLGGQARGITLRGAKEDAESAEGFGVLSVCCGFWAVPRVGGILGMLMLLLMVNFGWGGGVCAGVGLAFAAACWVPRACGQQVAAVTAVQPLMAAAGLGQERDYCTLAGQVVTPNGGGLAGASVAVTGPLETKREVVADSQGHFAMVGLPPGTFTVTVSLDGFTSLTGSVRLAPEANTATARFTLYPAVSDSVTVTASTHDIAESEMHLAEQQRVAGIFPNFYVSYVWRAVPLTSGEKFRLALKNAADPGNLLLVGTVAGVQQATNSFPGYGQGWKGYGRRYGADLGNLVSGTFMGGAILPSIFRQDPRYFYKGTGGVSSRFWYAVSRTVVTRGDNGRPEPNYSTLLGDMSSGAISNLYYAPEDRRGGKATIANGLLGIAGDAMNDVFQEFVLKKLTTKSKRNSVQP
jgi:hypothetical protein